MYIKLVVTAKRSLSVVERRNVTKIEIDQTNWKLTHSDNTTSTYAIASYNIRILGVVE